MGVNGGSEAAGGARRGRGRADAVGGQAIDPQWLAVDFGRRERLTRCGWWEVAYGKRFADPVEETLVGNYGEGTASGEIIGLTNVGAIVAAIQSHRNQILKDGNGNMVIARDKWIVHDYENRLRKVVTAEGASRNTPTTRRGSVEGDGAGNDVFAWTVYEDRGTERIRYVHAGTAWRR
ncbi:MAG: hypothetical protein IPQ26_10590 [Elusimicrobia bacterium]|nr:hypothetical protein [Elusimicrobiota bacterium]